MRGTLRHIFGWGAWSEIKRRLYRRSRLVEKWALGLLGLPEADSKKIWEKWGPSVRRGPLQDVSLRPSALGSHLGARLLGTYEKELFPVWDAWFKQENVRLVDIGAAEGYYAVGMLVKNPSWSAVAFDSSLPCRLETRRLARENGVEDRLRVFGAVSSPFLERCLAEERTKVICDIEGAEWGLLTRQLVQRFPLVEWLVEIHAHPGQTDGLQDSWQKIFSDHWKLSFLPEERRRPGDVKDDNVRSELGDEGIMKLLNEGRSHSRGWVHARPC